MYDDDKKKRLRVVTPSNVSIRQAAQPKQIQQPLQVRQNNQPLRVTNAPQQQVRIRTQNQPVAKPATLRIDPRTVPVKRTTPAAPTPMPKPKQSFFNKVRDVFDANTEADKYRREQGNLQAMREGRINDIKPITLERPGNFITETIGAIPRMVNTGYRQLGQLQNVAETAFAQRIEGEALKRYQDAIKSGDRARIAYTKSQLDKASARSRGLIGEQKDLNAKFQINDGGLFNAGTIYDQETAERGAISDIPKVAWNTVEGMADVASLGLTSVGAKQIAKLGFKQAVKQSGGLIAKNAVANFVQNFANAKGRQDAGWGNAIIQGGVGATVGTGVDIGLASLGSVIYKPLSRMFSRTSSRVTGEALEAATDYLTKNSDSNTVKQLLQAMEIGAKDIETLADVIARETDPDKIAKLINAVEIDPNLSLTPEVIKRIEEEGIEAVRQNPDILYEAQYNNNEITARGQSELDKYVYQELGHHVWRNKLTPEEQALFDGSGVASKNAVNRPGYTQNDILSEDFTDYFDKAVRGRLNEVPEKYRAVVAKYARVANEIAEEANITPGLRPDAGSVAKAGDVPTNQVSGSGNVNTQIIDVQTKIKLRAADTRIDEAIQAGDLQKAADLQAAKQAILDGVDSNTPGATPPAKVDPEQLAPAATGTGTVGDAVQDATGIDSTVARNADQVAPGTVQATDVSSNTSQTAQAISKDAVSTLPPVSELEQVTFSKRVTDTFKQKYEDLIRRAYGTPQEPGTQRVYQVGDSDNVALDAETLARQFGSTINENETIKFMDVNPADLKETGKPGVAIYNLSLPPIDNLNPSGGIGRSIDYDPTYRATAPLAKNMQTLDKTLGGSPDDMITVYRGVDNEFSQSKIVPGDYITDMPELAQSYTGDGNVIEMQVRKGDIIDDATEPGGNEYIYRPKADKEIATNATTPEQQLANDILNPEPVGTVTRGAQKSLANDSGVPISVWEDISGYSPVSNADTIAKAEKAVKKDANAVFDKLREQGINSNDDVAELQVLFRDLIDQDKLAEAEELAKIYAQGGTDAGRVVQQFAALRKTTPTGALFEANKVIREANERWGGKGKKYALTPEKKNAIKALAENVQQYEVGTRERQIAEALLAKEVQRVVPASIGEKLSTAQVYAQLLNAKTAIRNIGGNGILAASESVSNNLAVPIDFLISLRNGRRTIARPKFLKKLGGFVEGGKQGAQDVKLGIRTTGEAGKFDIKSDVFQNRVGKALDKLLGYELQVPDKAFYMAQYEETLDSLMRAMKVDKPTNEMLAIANEEALQATFQNNSKLASGLQSTKRFLNVGKKFGVGDLVLKYPKTPGNIVAMGMNYSPWGFAKGLYTIAKDLDRMSVSQQRQAARDIGRAFTGSGLIYGGYVLAKNNIITANPSQDADVRALERNQSVGAYSFNVSALQRFVNGEDTTPQQGDVVANYDWAQPTAIALSMGASMADKSEDAENALTAFLNSASAGVDTITEQPVIKNTTRFVGKATGAANYGQGADPFGALADAASGAPSSFIPSTGRQIAQAQDPYVRQTYDPNLAVQSFNRVKASLPFASSSLPQYRDTFGQPIRRYSGGVGKRIFDSFINPAFVDEIRRTPEGQMVFDIYNSTGETKQFPRVADKKVTIDGKSRQLTADEYDRYQEFIGTKTQEAFSELANNQSFMNLPDEQKATTMSNILSDIGKAGRIEILGAEYDKVDNNVMKILNGKVGSFTSKIPEKLEEGIAKDYYKEIAYMDDDTLEEWLQSDPTEIANRTAQRLNEVLPEGLTNISPTNKIAKMYAEFKKNQAENNWTKIETINKTEDLWTDVVKANHSSEANEIYSIARSSNNELKEFIARDLIPQESLDAAIELDNELYRSGLRRSLAFSEKFRKSYGYAIPDLVESVKSQRQSAGTSKKSSGSSKDKLKKANVSGFRLGYASGGAQNTKKPTFSSVPTRPTLRFNVPKAVNVTPIRLEL